MKMIGKKCECDLTFARPSVVSYVTNSDIEYLCKKLRRSLPESQAVCHSLELLESQQEKAALYASTKHGVDLGSGLGQSYCLRDVSKHAHFCRCSDPKAIFRAFVGTLNVIPPHNLDPAATFASIH